MKMKFSTKSLNMGEPHCCDVCGLDATVEVVFADCTRRWRCNRIQRRADHQRPSQGPFTLQRFPLLHSTPRQPSGG